MSLDQPNDFVKHQTLTRDAFLGGRLTLSQPGKGFRAGMDSVLLGASVAEGTDRLLDLGAGVGTAALVALAMGRARNADLLERDAATAELAASNIMDNGLAPRAKVLVADIAARASERRSVGLGENAYDAVIANPPFFETGQGTEAPNRARADARHMGADSLDAWLRCAAGSACANGRVTFIYPARGLSDLLSAFESRFGGVTILPLAPRPNVDVSRVLVRGTKGSRAPLRLLPTRAMHGQSGNAFSPEFDAIFRGEAVLDW